MVAGARKSNKTGPWALNRGTRTPLVPAERLAPGLGTATTLTHGVLYLRELSNRFSMKPLRSRLSGFSGFNKFQKLWKTCGKLKKLWKAIQEARENETTTMKATENLDRDSKSYRKPEESFQNNGTHLNTSVFIFSMDFTYFSIAFEAVPLQTLWLQWLPPTTKNERKLAGHYRS